MTDGMICLLDSSIERKDDSIVKYMLINQKWNEIRKPLLKRIEQEKAGIFKRSQKPIRAIHVTSSAVQYRKVV